MKFRTSRMATLAIPLIALLGAAAASQVQAQTHIATQTEGEDPHAPVYVVASRATYLAGLQEVASDGLARRDSQGNALVIAKLRTQLEPRPHEPRYIITVHGSGYQLLI